MDRGTRLLFIGCLDCKGRRLHLLGRTSPPTPEPTPEPIATWAGRSAQYYEYHQLTHYQTCLFIFFRAQ